MGPLGQRTLKMMHISDVVRLPDKSLALHPPINHVCYFPATLTIVAL